jgi:Zn ribbon nucleic-acid-binding protein
VNDYWVYNADEQELDANCVACGFNSKDAEVFVAHVRTHETRNAALDWAITAEIWTENAA